MWNNHKQHVWQVCVCGWHHWNIYKLLIQDRTCSSECFPLVCKFELLLIADKITNCCDEISDPTGLPGLWSDRSRIVRGIWSDREIVSWWKITDHFITEIGSFLESGTGNVRSQSISKHGIDPPKPQYTISSIRIVNSLSSGRCGCNLKHVILILWIDILSDSCKIVIWWMPHSSIDDKSTVIWIMAWCRQAQSHYLHHWVLIKISDAI